MSRDQVEEEGRMCDKEEEKRIRRNTNWYELGSNRMSWDFFFFPSLLCEEALRGQV